MMKMSSCYDEQGFLPADCQVIDLRSVEGTCCYCDPDAASQIRAAVADLPLKAVHWIDTGDYHYLSLFWLERIDRPFALLHLDHHPDDQACAFGGEVLSCGSWVLEAREKLPMMKSCVTVMNASDPVEIPEGLPLYISLDKDVMSRDWARTDWDQGEMTLQEVMDVISHASEGREVIAADVCGELASEKGACGEDVDINLKTNIILDEFLLNLLAD